MKNTEIIERMRENFGINDEEAKAVELILDNKIKMNEAPEFLKSHPEINPGSFAMGFFACALTCAELHFDIECE